MRFSCLHQLGLVVSFVIVVVSTACYSGGGGGGSGTCNPLIQECDGSGDDAGNGDGGGADTGGTVNAGDRLAGAALAIEAPSTARSLAQGGIELCVDAVLLASQAGSGRFVSVGTLTQLADQWQYDPAPGDRLHMVWLEGAPTDCYVSRLEGTLNASGHTFFLDPHHVTVRVVREGTVDLTLVSDSTSSDYSSAIDGSWTSDGATFAVSLAEQGQSTRDYDEATGYEDYTTDDNTTGTISTDGFALDVNEHHFFNYYSYDGLALVIRDRGYDSTWQSGGHTYAFNGGRVKFNTENTFLADYPDDWFVGGTVTEDGAVIGGFGTGIELDAWVDIYLEVDGAQSRLERIFVCEVVANDQTARCR